ncbi:hypothetical protein [Ruegeria arenilitoris]|uniref:hypothetical protein n=1 Tax=Ruegeria arenilitoris TaxID=1173585 RepID=UPI00147CB31E|nr:hypothetical protein [Ruegeria arenilitoris]
MATKAELEAEVAQLRQQNEALKTQKEISAESDKTPELSDNFHLPTELSDALKKHGVDAADVEAMGNQLVDEMITLHKEHPLVTLLGVFAVGCIVGRAFK